MAHGLQHQHTGEDMLLGKMTAEYRLAHADALDAFRPLARLIVGDAVHQGEGVAVGQNLRDLIGIQFHGQSSHFFSSRLPLCPPKPRELLMA